LTNEPIDVDTISCLKRLGKVFKSSWGVLDRRGRVVTDGPGDTDVDPVFDDCGSIFGGQGDNVNGFDCVWFADPAAEEDFKDVADAIIADVTVDEGVLRIDDLDVNCTRVHFEVLGGGDGE